jgi:hypothetical protein
VCSLQTCGWLTRNQGDILKKEEKKENLSEKEKNATLNSSFC